MFLKSQDSQENQKEVWERACAALPARAGLLLAAPCLC